MTIDPNRPVDGAGTRADEDRAPKVDAGRGRPANPRHANKVNTPYAAVPHRVIDSPAFADLTASSVQALLILARQLTKNNNGLLQATRSYMKQRGLGSEHTIQRAIADLIAHGFLFRTKSGAYGQGAAKYAVTWLPIGSQRSGLTHVELFQYAAWHAWNPDRPVSSRGAKNPRGHKRKNVPNVQIHMCSSGASPGGASAISATATGAKNAHDVLMPIHAGRRHPNPALACHPGVQHRPLRRRRGPYGATGECS